MENKQPIMNMINQLTVGIDFLMGNPRNALNRLGRVFKMT